MNPEHLAYFRNKLRDWRDQLVEESRQTMDNLRDEVRDVGDEAERATRETENSLELRTRDRYRKLISKIDKACAESRKAATVSAKRPTRKSASNVSMPVRSPRCRWMRRNVASICRSRWATE
jgi:RNA polymerase-binding protein DksA